MTLEEALEKIAQLEREKSTLETQLGDTQASVARLEAKRDDLLAEKRQVQGRVADAEEKIKELEQQIAVKSSSESEAVKLLNQRIEEINANLKAAEKRAEQERVAREKTETENRAIEAIAAKGIVHNPRRFLALARLEYGNFDLRVNALGDGIEAVINDSESLPLDKLLQKAQEKIPEAFKAPSPGLGTLPNQPGTNAVTNTKKGWRELTTAEQNAIYRSNPEKAKEMMRAAGLKIQ